MPDKTTITLNKDVSPRFALEILCRIGGYEPVIGDTLYVGRCNSTSIIGRVRPIIDCGREDCLIVRTAYVPTYKMVNLQRNFSGTRFAVSPENNEIYAAGTYETPSAIDDFVCQNDKRPSPSSNRVQRRDAFTRKRPPGRADYDFHDTPTLDALRSVITDLRFKKVVMTSIPSGRVTFTLTHVRPRFALAVACKLAGYDFAVIGDTLFVGLWMESDSVGNVLIQIDCGERTYSILRPHGRDILKLARRLHSRFPTLQYSVDARKREIYVTGTCRAQQDAHAFVIAHDVATSSDP